ncbi:MAG: hypothetical protein IT380_29185 [Myxococcales bacterium]|nr:hypothetical protein [Myxococcales bacterium]
MRALFVVAALGLAGCASEGPPRLYDQNDMELAAANGARMGCSCLFVMERDEEYCRAWVKASPNVAKLRFDSARKRVEASVFISFAATAHYVDDQVGCVLE